MADQVRAKDGGSEFFQGLRDGTLTTGDSTGQTNNEHFASDRTLRAGAYYIESEHVLVR